MDAQGYDCSFVEKPPDEVQTDCPICFLVLRDPSQLVCCGHVFCTRCIEKALRDGNGSCPMCARVNPTIFVDQHFKRMLASYRVYCIHQEQEEETGNNGGGCTWSGELGQLETHLNFNPTPDTQLNGCQYVEVNCNSCNGKIKRSCLNRHQSNLCPQRSTMCPHCNYISTHVVITQDHLHVCPKFPSQCPHCDTTFEREDLNNHIDNECLLAPIVCDFHPVGCRDNILRVELATHMKAERMTHTHLLIEATTDDEIISSNHLSLYRDILLVLSSENAALMTECESQKQETENLQNVQLVLILAVAVLVLVVIVLAYSYS